MQLTLVSMVDDSVIRYPYQKSRGYICESTAHALCRHVIGGHPIIISSAFLVQNDDLFNMFKSRSDNIFKAMIRNERIFILSDTGDIVNDQLLKAGEHEHMAMNLLKDKGKFEDFKIASKIFYKDKSRKRHDCILMPTKKEREMHDKMRRKLIEKMLKSERPHTLGFSVSDQYFDRFRRALELNLSRYTPRSACEMALDETNAFVNFLDGDNPDVLKDDVMTFANEAFYLSRSAAMSESKKFEIFAETNYSARFNAEIPYISNDDYGSSASSIRVPLDCLIRNRKNVIDKMFQDEIMINFRNLYCKNKASRTYALQYEKAISDILGMKKTISENIDEKTESLEIYITAGTVGCSVAYGVFKKLEEIKTRELPRNEFLKFIAATGLLAITAECLVTTYGPGILARKIGKYSSVENINQDIFHDPDVERIIERLEKAKIPNVATNSTSENGCAMMTALRVNTNSLKYKEWKISEGIL